MGRVLQSAAGQDWRNYDGSQQHQFYNRWRIVAGNPNPTCSHEIQVYRYRHASSVAANFEQLDLDRHGGESGFT